MLAMLSIFHGQTRVITSCVEQEIDGCSDKYVLSHVLGIASVAAKTGRLYRHSNAPGEEFKYGAELLMLNATLDAPHSVLFNWSLLK